MGCALSTAAGLSMQGQVSFPPLLSVEISCHIDDKPLGRCILSEKFVLKDMLYLEL
jgi:hypothetical protein